MSYSLDLFFEPAVQKTRLLHYLAGRKHFTVSSGNAVYENRATGVYFFIKMERGTGFWRRSKVVSAEFEVNYNRPSYFGIEAEAELAAFVAEFRPRLHDPQIDGMGDGPYSRDRFLSGWNFGNVFAVGHALSPDHERKIQSMPTDELRVAWEWNYQQAKCAWRNPSCFVPVITFFRIEERHRSVVLWPEGRSAILPKADYVLVGRHVSGEKRVGLACWSEVLELARRAGFEVKDNRLKLAYLVTPALIKEWVASITLIDFETMQPVAADQILDHEVIAAARESVERNKDI